MKLNQKGIAPIVIMIIIGVLAAGIAGGGAWYWQDQQLKKQETENQNKISVLEADKKNLEKDKQTAEEQIKTLAGSSQTVKTTVQNNEIDQIKSFCLGGSKTNEVSSLVYVENGDGKFANCGIVNKGEGGGLAVIAKKINNTWTKIWEGNGDIDQVTISKYKIPSSIYAI